MSENLLSNNLDIITAEIKILETNMTRSLVENGWEIGRRLMYAKNTIKHGEFGDWVDKNFGFSHQYANQFMKFYNDNPNYNSSSNFNKLPSWKHVVEVMYLPSSVDKESFIEEEVIKDDGETKSAKEIADYKKKLKEQSESHQRQLAEKDEVINKTYEQLEKAQNQEPKKVIIEKTPDDYEKYKQEALNSKLYLEELERVKKSYGLLETKYSLLESSTAEAKKIERKLQSMKAEEKSILDKMQAIDDFIELEVEFNQFFDTKMAPMRFKGIANYLYGTNAVERIKFMINQADLWVEEMNKLIPNTNIKIIEGEFTDE